MNFDFHTGTVEVEVSRADDLPQVDLLGKSDPFVEIYCGGAKIGRTKTVWKTLNPKWDGEFFKLRDVPGIVHCGVLTCCGAFTLLM